MVRSSSTTTKNKYGLISMIAIIVGTIIGSGIYIKNSGLFVTTNSAIFVTIGWILGGLIVLSMFIAFIEIMSITTKKNEQGTFSNWSRHLWGEHISKYIGLYFIFFYFPLIIAAEGIFAANYFTELVFGASTTNVYGIFFFINFITVSIILIAFLLNIFFKMTGKVMQTIGSVIKVIPLFVIVGIAILVIIGLFDGINTNDIFDPSAPINSSPNEITSIILIIPPILFAMDGILFAASTSKEAKKPSTYKNAAIISIIFVVLIYITFSLSSFFLGNISSANGDGFSIEGVIANIFNEKAANILIDISLAILIISISVATFGYAIFSMWSLADASNFDDIADKKGLFLRRTKNGNPYMAGMFLLIISLLMLLIMRSFDIISIFFINDASASSYIGMSNFISNLITTTNFALYSFLILGALINRKTQKVETEKVKFFWVFAIFTIFMMSVVILTSIYTISSSIFDSEALIYESILKLSIIILFIGSFFAISKSIIKKSNSLTDFEKRHKHYFKAAYDAQVEVHIFFKENNINMNIEENYLREKLYSNIYELKQKYKKLKDKKNKKKDGTNIEKKDLDTKEDNEEI